MNQCSGDETECSEDDQCWKPGPNLNKNEIFISGNWCFYQFPPCIRNKNMKYMILETVKRIFLNKIWVATECLLSKSNIPFFSCAVYASVNAKIQESGSSVQELRDLVLFNLCTFVLWELEVEKKSGSLLLSTTLFFFFFLATAHHFCTYFFRLSQFSFLSHSCLSLLLHAITCDFLAGRFQSCEGYLTEDSLSVFLPARNQIPLFLSYVLATENQSEYKDMAPTARHHLSHHIFDSTESLYKQVTLLAWVFWLLIPISYHLGRWMFLVVLFWGPSVIFLF